MDSKLVPAVSFGNFVIYFDEDVHVDIDATAYIENPATPVPADSLKSWD